MNSRSFTVCVLAHFIFLLNQPFESSCQPLHFHHKRMLPFGKELNGSRGPETELNPASLAEVTSQDSVGHEQHVSSSIDGSQDPATNIIYRSGTGGYVYELSDGDIAAIDALPEVDTSDDHHSLGASYDSQSSVISDGRHPSLNGKEEAGSGSPASDTESIASSSRSNQSKNQEKSTWSSSDPNRKHQELATKSTAESSLRQSVRSHDASKNHEDRNNYGRDFKRQKVGPGEQNTSYRTSAKESWKEPDEAESSLKAGVSSNSNTEKDTTD